MPVPQPSLLDGCAVCFSVLQPGLEGVEVIEQASPEGDHAAIGLAEVGVREFKA